MTLTNSSCVEHPVHRLFLSIAAHLDLRICVGEASDAFAHSPGPYVTTFVCIYNQFTDWYRHRFGKNIDRDNVLPILISLQGHP